MCDHLTKVQSKYSWKKMYQQSKMTRLLFLDYTNVNPSPVIVTARESEEGDWAHHKGDWSLTIEWCSQINAIGLPRKHWSLSGNATLRVNMRINNNLQRGDSGRINLLLRPSIDSEPKQSNDLLWLTIGCLDRMVLQKEKFCLQKSNLPLPSSQIHCWNIWVRQHLLS